MRGGAASELAVWKAKKGVTSEYDLALIDLNADYEKLLKQYRDMGPVVKRQIDLWKEQKQALIEAKKAQKEYNDSVEGGIKNGMAAAKDTVLSEGETIKQGWIDTTSSMADAFGTFFTDVVKGEAKSVGEYLLSFFDSVVSNIMNMFAKNLAGSMMGGGGSGLFSFLGWHAGGGVGYGGNTMHLNRPGFNPASFAFAPKFHDGLAGDEFPAILQKGETVIPKGYALGGSGTPKEVEVKIYNDGDGQAKVTKSESHMDFEKMIIEVWIDSHYNNKHGLRSYMGG